ncbi:MAG: nucleoside deaminase [Gemmatimonadales bacterium]
MAPSPENDERFLRLAIEAARRARERGNHPFGAVLVDSASRVLLEAENSVLTDRDPTAHAELSLIRMAGAQYDPSALSACTLYASTEPCPMCSGAIYWGGVRRLVYGLGQAGFYELAGGGKLVLSCREVLAAASERLEVVGPLIEDEAARVHEGFWSQAS